MRFDHLLGAVTYAALAIAALAGAWLLADAARRRGDGNVSHGAVTVIRLTDP